MTFLKSLLFATVLTTAILIGATNALLRDQVVRKTTTGEPYFARFDNNQNASSEVASTGDVKSAFDLDGLEFELKLVKNASFSATLIVEVIQTAADGTSRTRAATSLIYRDSKGRTRRDRMPIESSASTSTTDQQPQSTTINDPVAGFTYASEHRARLFRRTAFVFFRERDSGDSKTKKRTSGSGSEQITNSQILPMPMNSGSGQALGNVKPVSPSSEIKNEQLGEREIEGVKAEGTRISTSVPAGAIGNEQAIEIIIERWYSPELQTPILIRLSDPRFGESIYRLTNIKRDEPAATFFVVPKDYKVTDETGREVSLRN